MDGVTFLILAWLVIGGGYAISCWLWPYRECPKCEGAGKFRPKPDSKVMKVCKRCGGNGRVLRIGRRIYNRWHREKTGASR